MNERAFQRYLATGEYVPTEDAAPKKSSSLAAHDKRFHPNGFDPKKGRCQFREAMAKGDKSDAALMAAEKKEQEQMPFAKSKINPTEAEIDEAARATSEAFGFLEQGIKDKISDMLNGKRVFMDKNGSLLDIALAMKGKGNVVRAIKERAKEQFIPADHPWLNENFWKKETKD